MRRVSLNRVIDWVRGEVVIGGGYPYVVETADQGYSSASSRPSITSTAFYKDWAEGEDLTRFSRKMVQQEVPSLLRKILLNSSRINLLIRFCFRKGFAPNAMLAGLNVGVNVVAAAVEPAEEIMQKTLEFRYKQGQLFSH